MCICDFSSRYKKHNESKHYVLDLEVEECPMSPSGNIASIHAVGNNDKINVL